MGQKVALITSAAKGLGHPTVHALLHGGWDVAFTYRTSHAEAEGLMQAAKACGRQAMMVQADLLRQADVVEMTRAVLERFGRVDAFIHNFGPFRFSRRTVAETSESEWSGMLDGNLNAFVWIYQRVVGGMRDRHFGRIVTFGFDGAGTATGWGERGAYAAAKAALAALTRSIAEEEGPHGITANMVCPGDIRGLDKEQGERRDPSPQTNSVIGGDVARVVRFLCEDDNHALNGAVIPVHGGQPVILQHL